MEKVKLDEPEDSKDGAGAGVLGTGTAAPTNYHVQVPLVHTESAGVPRFHKLDFPTFDGKKDLLP